MARKTFSRRAEILKRVLDWINQGEYDDQGDYVIFGKSLVEVVAELTGMHRDEAGVREGKEILIFASNFLLDRGRELAGERTSLKKTPSKIEEHLEKLSRPALESVAKALEATAVEKHLSSETFPSRDESEFIDAKYADEAITKLDKIMRRVSQLDPVKAGKIPGEKTQIYFEEAHRCYLYGFPIASAVLCRALLESALTEKIDPYGRRKREMEEEFFSEVAQCRKAGKRPPKKPSYSKLLIQEANLTDDRPEWANKIIEAGNDAIHGLEKFQREWRDDRFADIVLNTRKVLEDLLAEEIR